MTEMRIAVVGAAGRMGRMLIEAIHGSGNCVLSGALERSGSPALGQDAGAFVGAPAANVTITDDMETAFASANAVLDFTAPVATLQFAAFCASRSIIHVIGTTGLSAEDHTAIDQAAQHTVIVQSGNMSLGVNLLSALVKRATAALDESFDIEILEMHHRMKVDAPSGTALLLGEAAAAGREISLAQHSVRVRDGHTGSRQNGDIGFAALRGGTVVGDHTVILAGTGERIELRHIAEDRGIFAQGAVKAALWARNRSPGRYTMMDVLGLGSS